MRAAEEFCFGAAVEWPVLPIRAGGQWYAVTLEELARLGDAREPEAAQLPRAALPGQAGGPLAVFLRGSRGLFTLLAEEADTMVSVPPEARLPLPEPLPCPENGYLQGAFYWEERGVLCLLLRCGRLEPEEEAI